MQYCHLFQDFGYDFLDEPLPKALSLLIEELQHISSVGLVLHQHHRVDGFEYLDEGRYVVRLQVMKVAYFILHQFDTWVMQQQYLQFFPSSALCYMS